MNIMFCGNDKIFDGLITCCLSIVKRRESKDDLNFYILTMDLTNIDEKFKPVSDLQIQFLNDIFKEYGNITFIKKDVTELYNKYLLGNANEKAYCSPYTLLRLIADLIDDLPSKMLYLDVDILFNGDIALLYNQDIDGYDYAGVKDEWGTLIIPAYINAGVLLFNLDHIKESNFLVRCRELILKRKLIWADQDAINFTKAKKKILSSKFNEIILLHDQKTIVRHFAKRLKLWPYPHIVNIKQWNISSIHKVFHYYDSDDILYEYIYQREHFNRDYLKIGVSKNIINNVHNGKY